MTQARDWAAKVDRAATDPERIKRRKEIAAAFTVERSVTYLSAEALAEMEASTTPIPTEHAARAKELRAKFMAPATTSLDDVASEFGIDLEALRAENP